MSHYTKLQPPYKGCFTSRNPFAPYLDADLTEAPDTRPILKYWPSTDDWTARDRLGLGISLIADTAKGVHDKYNKLWAYVCEHGGRVPRRYLTEGVPDE